VTGLWQVRRRLDNSFEQRMDDDLEYIQRWSILLDLWIVLRTVRVVLAGRGV
jgi:lipopolysaccharide/colanic/teichoic acid biosynthesis glycosyltransferase